MKARPRRVENDIAKVLSDWFESHGMSKVYRIPVLGRTGPDITPNEMKLVADAKSRKRVPKSYQISDVGNIWQFGVNLIGVRLADLDVLLTEKEPSKVVSGSITVAGWFNHMHQWTLAECPNGITALVLHWPRRRIENAVLVIQKKDRQKIKERIGARHETGSEKPNSR